MKDWKHLTFEQRKTISSGISHGYKLKDIGECLLVDPTSISKEVRRNRIEISIDETNTASLRLFENAGFIRESKEDELINFVYQRERLPKRICERI